MQQLLSLLLGLLIFCQSTQAAGQPIAGDNSPQCTFKVKWLVPDQAIQLHAQKLTDQLQQSFFSELGFCFQSPEVLPATQTHCQLDQLSRIDCDLRALGQKLQLKEHFTQLVIMLEQGGANTRGGIMYLDSHDSLQVVQHEISHWLGYVDEYKIAWDQQRSLCAGSGANWIGKNIFVTQAGWSQAQVDKVAGKTVYPTNTCRGTDRQAYKLFSGASFLEFLDRDISPEYKQHMAEHIEPNLTVPAAMNLALANRVEDHEILSNQAKDELHQAYLFWLKQAANRNYPPAMRMWSQQLVQNNKLVEAYRQLSGAAAMGDPTAQVLLGHSYLEGSWLPRDLRESAHWYDKAAQQADPFGLYFYGKCFEMGWGCIQSKNKAIELYQKAAGLGSDLASRRLKQLDLVLE